ncbi:hypothetical protein D3C76_1461420 [compost metagenome]
MDATFGERIFIKVVNCWMSSVSLLVMQILLFSLHAVCCMFLSPHKQKTSLSPYCVMHLRSLKRSWMKLLR